MIYNIPTEYIRKKYCGQQRIHIKWKTKTKKLNSASEYIIYFDKYVRTELNLWTVLLSNVHDK